MPENSAATMPILVGCGEVTDNLRPPSDGRSPYDIMAEAARLALLDTASTTIGRDVETLAVIRQFADTSHRFATRLGRSSNPPASVARRLGLTPQRLIYTWNGGNMPQALVNLFAEEVAQGRCRAAMIVGGEALRTQHGVERAGLEVDWNEDPGGAPELLGDPRRGWSDYEDRHHMRSAIAIYPLIENAIRGAAGRPIAAHLQAMGELFSRFAAVARDNPLAARREGYDARQLSTIDDDNRWIGFPYPRRMNSSAFNDQAAALLLTSVEVARAHGIPDSKWVYLHGCADGHDHWYLSERPELHRSHAIRHGARLALDMAGIGLDDIRHFDIYSCFPSAVEAACAELGLAEDDPRGLTVTGGLPYFGGPGNNYVTHSIAQMMKLLRRERGHFGLVTANGNYLTKHSFGVYSTRPQSGPWRRQAPALLQSHLDALPKAPLNETPSGRGVIETYTIMHGRHGPDHAIVIGRDAGDRRFIANTEPDPAVMLDLQERDSLGRPGEVRSHDGRNIFQPA